MKLLQKSNNKGFLNLSLVFPVFYEKVGEVRYTSFNTEIRYKITKEHKLFFISILGFGLFYESYKRLK